MQLLVWEDRFNTGVKMLDADHKTVFDILNQFILSKTSGGSKETCFVLMSQLYDTLKHHYAREERMMDLLGIRCENHINMHHQVLDKMSELSKNQSGCDDAIEVILHWIHHHIEQDDQVFSKYATFLNKNLLKY